MKRTTNSLPGKRAGSVGNGSSQRRLRGLLVLALAACALAFTIRALWKRAEPPQSRYLADTVLLSSPPPLLPPDETNARELIHRLEPLRAAMNADRRDPEAAARFARASLDAGDLLEARDGFGIALRAAAQPGAGILAGLGEADQKLGLCRDALAVYRLLTARFPNDERGYLGQSQAEDLLSRRSDAANALDLALIKLPAENIAGRIRVVAQLEAFGDLARSLREARTISDGAPNSPDAALQMAHLLIKAERPGEARMLLKRILRRDPSNVRARYQLGVALDSPLLPDRDPLLAEDALLTAIESGPGVTPAYRRLIEMYEEQGRPRQCAYVSLQLLAIAPESAEARLHLAYAYARLGDERAAAGQRSIAVALLNRDHETARLSTLLRQRPEDAGIRLALGRHNLLNGRALEALSAFQAAFALAPHRADVRRELSALALRLGLSSPAGVPAR